LGLRQSLRRRISRIEIPNKRKDRFGVIAVNVVAAARQPFEAMKAD
jgi:hypothetical protein